MSAWASSRFSCKSERGSGIGSEKARYMLVGEGVTAYATHRDRLLQIGLRPSSAIVANSTKTLQDRQTQCMGSTIEYPESR